MAIYTTTFAKIGIAWLLVSEESYDLIYITGCQIVIDYLLVFGRLLIATGFWEVAQLVVKMAIGFWEIIWFDAQHWKPK